MFSPDGDTCPQAWLKRKHRQDFERIAKILENKTEITDDELVNLLCQEE